MTWLSSPTRTPISCTPGRQQLVKVDPGFEPMCGAASVIKNIRYTLLYRRRQGGSRIFFFFSGAPMRPNATAMRGPCGRARSNTTGPLLERESSLTRLEPPPPTRFRSCPRQTLPRQREDQLAAFAFPRVSLAVISCATHWRHRFNFLPLLEFPTSRTGIFFVSDPICIWL